MTAQTEAEGKLYTVRSGDRGPALELTLYNADGTVKDLTGVTNAKLTVASVVRGRRLVDELPMTLAVDRTTGVVSYAWRGTEPLVGAVYETTLQYLGPGTRTFTLTLSKGGNDYTSGELSGASAFDLVEALMTAWNSDPTLAAIATISGSETADPVDSTVPIVITMTTLGEAGNDYTVSLTHSAGIAFDPQPDETTVTSGGVGDAEATIETMEPGNYLMEVVLDSGLSTQETFPRANYYKLQILPHL